jgi:proline racemase
MRLTNLITAVDLHACGEPGRVITGGVLDVPGQTMFEKMKYFEKNHDDIRLRLLREPRGYPALCCNLILPPTRPEADAGFIIMEQVEYPPMSGTNTICVATTLLETGILPMREPVTEFVLEAPAGLVGIRAECKDGKVTQVTFKNVPAFAVHLDVEVEVPRLGTVTVDVAWGGMFYVIAETSPGSRKWSKQRHKSNIRSSTLRTPRSPGQPSVNYPRRRQTPKRTARTWSRFRPANWIGTKLPPGRA